MVDFYYPNIFNSGGGGGSGGADVLAYYVLTQSDANLANSKVLTPGPGIAINVSGGNVTLSTTGTGSGSVTSVGVSAPSDVFSVGSSPITVSGVIALTKVSQSSGLFYASPSGGSGVPVFRQIANSDLPLTAGSNIYLTPVGSLLSVSATGLQAASSILNALASSLPGSTGFVVQTSDATFVDRVLQGTANRIVISNGSGVGGVPTFDVGSNVFTINTSTTLNNLSSGTASQNRTTLGVPAATDAFLVTGTVPSDAPNARNIVPGTGIQITDGGAGGTLSIASSGALGGTVTSVGFTSPASIINTAGAPVTSSGTIVQSLVSQPASTFWGGPLAGINAAPTFRAIASSDIFQALTGNLIAGSNITITPTGVNNLTIASTAGSSNTNGTVTNVLSGNFTPLFNVNVATPTTVPTFSFTAQNAPSGDAYMGPVSGAPGVPSFRPIQGTDLTAIQPGSNITVTNSGSALIIASTASGSGGVTSVGLTSPGVVYTVSNSPITISGNIVLTLVNQASGTAFMGPLNGSNAAPSFRPIQATDLGVLVAGSNVTLSTVGSSIVVSSTASGGGGGSVTTVSDFSPLFTTGSRTTTPTFSTINQSQGLGYFSPTNSTGAPTFRNVASGDLGSNLLDYTHGGTGLSATPSNGQLSIGNGAGYALSTITPGSGVQITNGSGSITISSFASAAILSAGNLSPLFTTTLTNGALTFSQVSESGNTFYASPSNGTSGNPSFRGVSANDITGVFTAGSNISIIGGSTLTISATGLNNGTVTSVGDFSPLFTTATRTTTPAFSAVNQNAALFYSGPLSGGAAAPTFRALASSDTYTALTGNLIAGTNITVTPNGNNTVTIASTAGSSNTTGTVTNVTSGNLTNFATVSVGTSTTTPAFAFTLTQPGSGQFWGGPTSGSAAAPNYRYLVLSDLPTGVVTSVTNGDGTLTISPNTGNVVASIATSAPLAGSPTTTTQSSGDSSTKIATTAFVATAIANAISGVNPGVAVTAATVSASDTSAWTYNNGVSGVGATFTGPVNTAIVIDGVTFNSLTQSLLSKNDTQSPSGAFNGLYNLTAIQTVGTGAIFTRRLDYDQSSDINNTGAIPVISGTVNADTSWILTSQVTNVGVDPLTYAQFTLNPTKIQTTTLTTNHIWVGNGSNIAADTALVAGPNITISETPGTNVTISSTASGSVTNVLSGNASPLFTTTVGTSTSTATISYNISSAAASTFYAGPTSGSSASPSFRGIQGSDLGAIAAGTNITLDNNGSSVVINSTGGGGGGTVDPGINGFRMTLLSGNPLTTADISGVAASTIYVTPYVGNALSLYDGNSTWTTYTTNEMSIAVPSFLHRIYDVFSFNNSGTPALELNAWDSGGQVTGSITGVSIGTPVTITATNTLSNGQIVYIDGISGTAGTTSTNGLNNKAWVVSSASSTGFVAAGANTTALAYTSGGTFYVMPTTRTTGLAYQNGVYVKSGTSTRRYMGTICTVASAQTADSHNSRFVYNYNNRVVRDLHTDPSLTTQYTYASATLRASNNCTDFTERMNFVIGVSEDAVVANSIVGIGGGGTNTAVENGIGANTCTVDTAQICAYRMQAVASPPGTAALFQIPSIGHNFYQRVESAPRADTTTFFITETGTSLSNAGTFTRIPM